MARQIRETPILYGNDARRFESRMKNPPKETLKEREARLSHYQTMLYALKAGEVARQNGEMPSCIVEM